MLNRVILVGRLVQDPEIRYTQSKGDAVASFTLAVNRPFLNQQGGRDADFINIVTWRRQAENCSQYLKKGSLVAVSGRLQVRSYDDSQGIRRKVAEVVADEVSFLDRPRSSTEETVGPDSFPGDEMTVNEDDIPF
ncbi:MAG TPA: single-stranded DNA-binding protein [Bacillota bacterium]|jgi:single-strand DNA-binding protein|nr:single-stranded DNA-binding protein [Bacillota bacterium]HOB87648.1 single-stranded DNA-binding protein [Bacillota bacterium]HOP68236.1 single-stranded DNA-binding protein [Bacillota bacterium]HPT33106.1 single-stranded DNA-binding protein [Bacillota bacterium]HPZ64643.1 single-stranded DNA-binding protein [Bacillota bacterium]